MNASITVLAQTQEPLTHGAGSVGNVGVANRVTVNGRHGPVKIPFISGNSFRHKIRAAAYEFLRVRLGLSGRLTQDQVSLLLHGGFIRKGANAGGFEDLRLIASLADVMPLVNLLGGCLPGQTITGAWLAGNGYPVCEETRGLLPTSIRELLPSDLPTCSEIVSVVQYTRGEPSGQCASDLSDAALDAALDGDGQMIMSTEVINPNTWLIFRCGWNRNVPEQVEGCLVHAVAAWALRGGILGGQSAKGHGKTEAMLLEGRPEPEQLRLMELYESHVDANAEASRRWLDDIYDAKPKLKLKPAAKGKGKGKTEADAEEAGDE